MSILIIETPVTNGVEELHAFPVLILYFPWPSLFRPARAPTAYASTSAPTSRVRWWSLVTTVIRCRIISAAVTSTPATSWRATGPSTSTPTTAAASTSWGPESTASSATGGPPAPPPGPSAESQIFNQESHSVLLILFAFQFHLHNFFIFLL